MISKLKEETKYTKCSAQRALQTEEPFKQSTWQEQIRLMTIAPLNWGRIGLSHWFGSTHRVDGCILCHRTSKSMEIDKFYLQKEQKTGENLLLLREVSTFQDIAVQNFVIIERNDVRYPAQVLEIDLVEENLLIQSYKSPFPIQSHYTTLVKFRKNLNIHLQDVIACLLVEPTVGRRGQLTLSREQFI
ncbi:unnamed protein product [Rotaria magnacalcarata]|uniref:Uncharacterized protein n=1 Tax=Rotaria magnacalcarata TaxID=392030 RepID=A0A8S2KSB9_9BILA|nr:unnamed protein product [Rotaria magnacalcarata]CAF3851973.1 unnamed protein product [Rotaria magnacalcarata]CAF5131745.1 unnamed protein product [Rotaria magnacalcarata]